MFQPKEPKMKILQSLRLGFGLCVIALATPAMGSAQGSDPANLPQVVQVAVEESSPSTPSRFDGDVRALSAQLWKPGDPIREIPRRFYPKPGSFPIHEPQIPDRLVANQQQATQNQTEGTGGTFTTPNRNFTGITFTGATPPDTTGAVGLNHFVQSTNAGGGALIRIYDKAEPTPNQLAEFSLDSLGSGQCASGFGDPIVLYDRHAERWMLSEFSSSGNNLCMYVSQTPDPVSGGWYAYQFGAPSFPDYPKYGTWPTDANDGGGSYIVTANDGGPGLFAMDRGNMLAGNAATFIRVTIPGLSGFGFESPTPADLDGSVLPPSGSPAIYMRHRDTEVHSGPAGAPGDILEMWTFDVDWINTANSTLTQQASIDVADFDSSLCGLTSFNCFPQPGTGTTLDPLREVIMNRLQYTKHLDGFETLVGSFVVDIDGANTGGVRWFELRGGTPNWTLHQEGTYTIADGDNRFMSSAAMDQSQNIALAYNVSSNATFPSLRYTGRLADDTAGTMSQTETSIIAGTASSSSNRYGDYAQMSLDPADDCTFWFTGEFNTSSTWTTQIMSARFEACGCDLFPGLPTLSAANNGDNRVDLSWDDSDLDTVTEYRILRSRTPGGPYEKIAEVVDSSPGVSGGLGYAFSDFDVHGGIDYFYAVRSSDGAACTSPESNEVNVTATGTCTLPPVFGGVSVVDDPEFGVCTLELFWGAATPECGGPTTYNVYRSTVSGFTPGAGNLLAGGITDTALADLSQLVDGTIYYYIVQAVDTANGIKDDNVVQLGGEPDGIGGGVCTTGSACSDNPFVDVNPEGPLTVCQGGGPTLSADLASGSGPYTFQWIGDGVPIVGATGESFTPDELGVHTYNVRVSAQTCPDEVFDGLDTELTRVNRPFFSGLTSAINTQGSECTVDLQWSAATTVCDGPVTYNVYRDTVIPVATTHENLIIGGLSGTGYVDTFDLVDSQTYFYTVKAVDFSTGHSDDNVIALPVTPDGPFNGIQNTYFEDFTDASVIDDWTITTGPGPHTCGAWAVSLLPGARPSGGSGNYLIADNRCAPLLPRTSTTATSPPIDMVIGGLQSVTLKANIYFNYSSANTHETGKIEVWNGSQWISIWNSSSSDVNQQVSFDVTAHAANNPAFMVRFDYQNATTDQFFSFDNVTVVTDVLSVCGTEAAGPASVPRGSLSTARNGSGIDLTWDTSTCSAPNYNLLFGDLSNVSTYTLQGSVCSLGGSGNFSWSSLPAGDIYFLISPTDGTGKEGSWGLNSILAERNGLGASGQCGVSVKNPTNICE